MPTATSSRTSAKKTSAKKAASAGAGRASVKKVQPETKAKQKRQKAREELPLAQTLGTTIKRMRIERDWSQEQLAGEIECDRSFIGLIEQGKSNPSIFMLSVLARVFGVTLSQLLVPITADMNLVPTWQDKHAMKRRANRSTPERKPTPTRRLR